MISQMAFTGSIIEMQAPVFKCSSSVTNSNEMFTKMGRKYSLIWMYHLKRQRLIDCLMLYAISSVFKNNTCNEVLNANSYKG